RACRRARPRSVGRAARRRGRRPISPATSVRLAPEFGCRSLPGRAGHRRACVVPCVWSTTRADSSPPAPNLAKQPGTGHFLVALAALAPRYPTPSARTFLLRQDYGPAAGGAPGGAAGGAGDPV